MRDTETRLHPLRHLPEFAAAIYRSEQGTLKPGLHFSRVHDRTRQVLRMNAPTTLAIDIGGTGLKASVLDATGSKMVARVRKPTPYPCPPRVLIRALDKLTFELPAWDRVSVAFPGVVRGGRVLTAPNLSTKRGPGTPIAPKLRDAWAGYPLAAELQTRP